MSPLRLLKKFSLSRSFILRLARASVKVRQLLFAFRTIVLFSSLTHCRWTDGAFRIFLAVLFLDKCDRKMDKCVEVCLDKKRDQKARDKAREEKKKEDFERKKRTKKEIRQETKLVEKRKERRKAKREESAKAWCVYTNKLFDAAGKGNMSSYGGFVEVG